MDEVTTIFKDSDFNTDNIHFNYVESAIDLQAYSNEIDRRWEEKIEENNAIYNGISTYVKNTSIDPDQIQVTFSEMDYKNLSGLKAIFQEREEFDRIPTHAACSALIKNDEYYFFGHEEGDDESELKLIGGMIEPIDKKINLKSQFLREIKEETNIDKAFINFENGLYVFLTQKKTMAFVLKAAVQLPTEEILKQFEMRSDKELDKLILVPIDEIKERLKQSSRYFPILADIL